MQNGGAIVVAGFEQVVRINPDGGVASARRLSNLFASAAFETTDGGTVVISVDRIVRLDPSGKVADDQMYFRPMESPLWPNPPFNTIQSLEPLGEGGFLALSDIGLATVLDDQGHVVSQTALRGGAAGGSVRATGREAVFIGGLDGRNTNWIERQGADGASWRLTLEPDRDVPTLVGPYFVIGTHDGGALLATDVYSYSIDGAPQLWLVRVDRRGAVLWQFVYHLNLGDLSVQETRDGGFLLGGWRSVYGLETPEEWGVYQWLGRLEPSGRIRWARLYGDGQTFPLITGILEAPNGELYLSGPMGGIDGDDLVRHDTLIVMRTNPQGEVPGCSWMHPAGGGGELAPSPTMRISTIDPIDRVEATLTPDVAPSAVESTDLRPAIQQLCSFALPTPIPNLPTPSPAPTQTGSRYWIVGANGVIVGSVQNGTWHSVADPASLPPQAERFGVYLADGAYIGQAQRTSEDVGGLTACPEVKAIELSPDFSGIPGLALSGGWEAVPRAYLRLALDSSLYLEAVREYLESIGVAESETQLTSALRTDIEGDGVDEVLLSASYSDSSEVERSLVLLRRVAGNQVETLQLAPWTATDLLQFSVFGLFDLNGDGRLEAVLQGEGDQRTETQVFEFSAGGAQAVLQTACNLGG